jgi:predicted PurR-regulated permease PerM
MPWYWEYGNELLILFTFPLAGLVFDRWVPIRYTFYTALASVILLLPIFTGYFYVITWLYQLFALVLLGCLYSFLSRRIENRTTKTVISGCLSAVLFLVLAFFSFMDSFSGFQQVENLYKNNDYKVDYVTYQGFAGRPSLKYQLSKYTAIPVLIKKIETVRDIDTTQSCEINFVRSKVVFNKCELRMVSFPE